MGYSKIKQQVIPGLFFSSDSRCLPDSQQEPFRPTPYIWKLFLGNLSKYSTHQNVNNIFIDYILLRKCCLSVRMILHNSVLNDQSLGVKAQRQHMTNTQYKVEDSLEQLTQI